MKIKVCGMRDPANIGEVASLQPDLMGFIFYNNSPRDVTGQLSPQTLEMLPESITRVGVFVDAPVEYIATTRDKLGLDMVQLHGNESPEFCDDLKARGIRSIKVFHVSSHFNFQSVERYLDSTSLLLFDNKTSGKAGGTGIRFDWSLLEEYTYDKPFVLSGGISLDDWEEISTLRHPALYGVDINSRFEVTPGIKNTELIKRFIKKSKHAIQS